MSFDIKNILKMIIKLKIFYLLSLSINVATFPYI